MLLLNPINHRIHYLRRRRSPDPLSRRRPRPRDRRHRLRPCAAACSGHSSAGLVWPQRCCGQIRPQQRPRGAALIWPDRPARGLFRPRLVAARAAARSGQRAACGRADQAARCGQTRPARGLFRPRAPRAAARSGHSSAGLVWPQRCCGQIRPARGLFRPRAAARTGRSTWPETGTAAAESGTAAAESGTAEVVDPVVYGVEQWHDPV
jgi:hypothetical protein